MMRYFDIRDWDIEEMCDSLRERIAEAKKPLPKRVMKHSVSIILRTSPTSYQSPEPYFYRERFQTREEAEKFMDKTPWIERTGDNSWIELGSRNHKTYIDKEGNEVPYHYEINEYDYETWEDDEYHIEYSDSEKKMLSETLYQIEKARIYMDVYDHCCDQGSFGEGHFAQELNERLKKFEEEYNEDPKRNDEED